MPATGFTNWSENIKNPNAKIFYPSSDAEIIDLINKAKIDKQKLRVVGSAHSQCPIVCDYNEKITLLSLRDYCMVPVDIIFDHDKLTVTVNPGVPDGNLA